MDLISIIIPVYNVCDYLERCLESVIKQSYSNLEIILVNDGSTDNSGKICNIYSERDNRITVIHKLNGGLSDARNVGLRAASGVFFSFIDSDDFIHRDFIQDLYRMIIEYHADIAICGYERGNRETFSKKKKSNEEFVVFNSKEILHQWHSKYKHVETMAWNKLYRRELFEKNNIEYPVGYFNEDVQTTHLLVAEAEKIIITNKKLYYYFQRSGSITDGITNRKVNDNIFSQRKRLDFFKCNGYLEAYKRLYIKLMKTFVYYCVFSDSEEIRNALFADFRQNYLQVMRMRECDIKSKVIFFIFRYFYSGYIF